MKVYIDMEKPITLDRFDTETWWNVQFPKEAQPADVHSYCDPDFVQRCLIPYLEYLRESYLKTKELKYYTELIRWLPQSFVS